MRHLHISHWSLIFIKCVFLLPIKYNETKFREVFKVRTESDFTNWSDFMKLVPEYGW